MERLRRARRIAWGLGLWAATLASGCVERELYVRSEPAGAAVFLDGRAVGTTAEEPLRIRFSHYGTRELVLRKDGYLPRVEAVVLDPPWYQYPVLDLFADLLWPATIHDVHETTPETLTLAPRPAPRPAEEVLEDAERFAADEGRRP